jgi:hypothetical protein
VVGKTHLCALARQIQRLWEKKIRWRKMSVNLTNRFYSNGRSTLTADFNQKPLKFAQLKIPRILGDFSHVYTYQ